MNAQKCPVCEGSGIYIPMDTTLRKQCHGCDGKGWILVPVTPLVPYNPLNPNKPPTYSNFRYIFRGGLI